MAKDYSIIYEDLQALLVKLNNEVYGPACELSQLERCAMTDGAINHKMKTLMALGISLTQSGQADSIALYLGRALAAGVTRPEVLETIGVAIAMGGSLATVNGSLALEALDQFETNGLNTQTPRTYGP